MSDWISSSNKKVVVQIEQRAQDVYKSLLDLLALSEGLTGQAATDYKVAVGSVVFEITDKILCPIYEMFPELEPSE